jgi:hypothetical protein
MSERQLATPLSSLPTPGASCASAARRLPQTRTSAANVAKMMASVNAVMQGIRHWQRARI